MIFPFLFNRATMPTDPVFYCSTKKDTCDFNEQPFPAPNETASGSLCAYIPDTNSRFSSTHVQHRIMCAGPPRDYVLAEMQLLQVLIRFPVTIILSRSGAAMPSTNPVPKPLDISMSAG